MNISLMGQQLGLEPPPLKHSPSYFHVNEPLAKDSPAFKTTFTQYFGGVNEAFPLHSGSCDAFIADSPLEK